MLISDAFEMYRQECIIFNHQSVRTEEMSAVAMKTIISFHGDIPIVDLTFDHVRRWRDNLAKTRSQNTVRGYILKLRVVLVHLRLRGYEVLNPDLVKVPKRKQTVVTFLSPAEVSVLIDCVFKPRAAYSTLNRFRNRAIVSLLASSGIRVSELTALNRIDIREDRTFTVIGKGDKPRLCFVDDRAVEHIASYLNMRSDTDRALFISEKTGARVSKSTVEEVFRTATRIMGYDKPVTPHTIRHSFATDLLRNDTNLVYIRDFLGHKSIQTTEMYTHVVDEDLRKIYQKAHTS